MFTSFGNAFQSLATVFASIKRYAKDIPIVGSVLSSWFGYAQSWFNTCAVKCYDIQPSWNALLDDIGKTLSWDYIQNRIRSWLPNLENIINWFYNWILYVWEQIGKWWLTVAPTVQGWIDEAKQYLQVQVNRLDDWLSGLQVDWNAWVSKIPDFDIVWDWFGNWISNIWNLINNWWIYALPEVEDLINSIIAIWFPFYDALASLWNDIADFFTDPLQWLYDKLDEWFERFW